MQEITLIRNDYRSPKQILGRLFFGNFTCFTLELPDKDNTAEVSCIPAGEYLWRKRRPYGRFPYMHIDILKVPGRKGIKIHAGNYYSQIQGCILVGSGLLDINHDGLKDVVNSRLTLRQLIVMLPQEGIITIR